MPIRVLIADASAVVRSRIVNRLRDCTAIEIVGEASVGAEALSESLRLRPDVLVLDVVHPNTNSITILEEMRRAELPTRVIAMSDGNSRHWIRWASEAGACGHLVKDSDLADIVTIIEGVHAGKEMAAPSSSGLAVGEEPGGPPDRKRPNLLTEREQQVLALIAQGKTSRDVAAVLRISSRTVDAHRASIMKKLRVRSVADLVRYQLARRS